MIHEIWIGLYHPSVIGTGKYKSHIHMGYTGLYRFEKKSQKIEDTGYK